MKYVVGLLAGVAGVSALTACSIIAGLSDFDRAVDAKVDSGSAKKDSATDVAPEAAVDDDAAETADDSSPPEGDSGSDAPNDADDSGSDASDGSTSFCATTHTAKTIFCKDFDNGTSATSGWTGTYFRAPTNAVFPPDASTIMTLTSDDFVSPPASALLIVPRLTGNATGDAVQGQLQESLQFLPQLTINFAFKCPDSNSGTNLSIVRLANTSATWSVTIGLSGSSLYVTPGIVETDGATTFSSQDIAQPDLTQWTTISLFLDLMNNAATVSYNGVNASGTLTLGAPDLEATGGGLLLTMGLNYATEPLPTVQHLYFDNIDIEGQ